MNSSSVKLRPCRRAPFSVAEQRAIKEPKRIAHFVPVDLPEQLAHFVAVAEPKRKPVDKSER